MNVSPQKLTSNFENALFLTAQWQQFGKKQIYRVDHWSNLVFTLNAQIFKTILKGIYFALLKRGSQTYTWFKNHMIRVSEAQSDCWWVKKIQAIYAQFQNNMSEFQMISQTAAAHGKAELPQHAQWTLNKTWKTFKGTVIGCKSMHQWFRIYFVWNLRLMARQLSRWIPWPLI